MTRSIFVFFILTILLKANVDPLATSDLPSPTSELASDAGLFAGLEPSETDQSALPFDLSETISEEQSDEPVFLLSVIGLPRPAASEMSLVQSSTSYTPPQDASNLWTLGGAGLATLALIGAARGLRFRRTSSRRA